MSGFIGSGDLYVAYYDAAGTLGDKKLFGNATKFALTTAIETKSRISRGRDNYGRAIDRVSIPGESTFMISTDEANPETLALGMAAEINATTVREQGTQAAGTAAVLPAVWTPLAHHHVSNVVVTKTAPGVDPVDPADDVVTTYQLGRDYEIVAELGWIRRVATGTIGATDEVKISYAYAATNSVTIIPASQPIIRGMFIFSGKNLNTGRNIKVTIPNGQISSSSEVDLLSQEFLALEFSGTALQPTDGSEAVSIEYFV